ncbi:DUF5071 domain-containing protein [Paenibacillus sp. 481]|uniref:DUF5071 domain-containing protein n=1 Tax=Paenibacillus sp. 481 TaxID=2835869 RepID=UPI001E4B50D9|nr:DUF5071 domain-containing protein [Paenibacillus sp. 481]UHA73490.1 DUF5071 domain-containing protein [Paenibacillus sp. 481]
MPYDNDVLVFLKNGTGWMYSMNKQGWSSDTFVWKKNENGSLCIEGKVHEYKREEARESKILFNEVFYKVTTGLSGKVITFSSPISSDHTTFGLDDGDVPDLDREMTVFEKIHEQIKLLHWYTPNCIVDSVLQELIQIDDQHLHLLVLPYGKAYWDNAALVLSKIESKRLEVIIPDMIEWLYDLNWPGALEIAELLCKMGEPIIPHLKPYLSEYESPMTSNILSEIVENWPKSHVIQLKHELKSLTTQDETSEYAKRTVLEIFKEHELF